MAMELEDRSGQPLSISLTRPKANDLGFVVEGDEIDLDVAPVPEALDPMRQREVSERTSTPLLVQLGDEPLEAWAFGVGEACVCLIDEHVDRPEAGRGNGVLQGSEPAP